MTIIDTDSHEPPDMRAGLVSRGLRRLAIPAGARIGMLVCSDDAEDMTAALIVIAQPGYRSAVLNLHERIDDLLRPLDAVKCAVLFACARGVERWGRIGVQLRVIGDGLGVLWWRAFELREAVAARNDLRSMA